MLKQFVSLALLAVSFNSAAAWQLQNNSSKVSFVSIKKDTIGEVHHFKTLSGSITDNGDFSVEIDLTTVETNIPIRNERMQNMLFNTKSFAKLSLNAKVNKELAQLTDGTSNVFSVPATLSLNGVEKSLTIDVFAARTNNDSLLVTAMSPIIINASDFNLDAGVAALQKVAGLPNIARAVPVTFVLHFTQ
ncbi:YceI family protein [Pseudoalteromonas sp. SSM20]|uniref:YceI family protein n=1 Tax=Pseudoalteromonas sp. SSM20 TaxID=3139394 RepID=UPI003BABA54B